MSFTKCSFFFLFWILSEVQIELHVKDCNDFIGLTWTKVKFSLQLLMQTSSTDFCLNHFELVRT